MVFEKFDVGSVFKLVGFYLYVWWVGNLLFLLGIGFRDLKIDGVLGLECFISGNYIWFDFEVQCYFVFQNVWWVLEDSGVKWEDFVDVMVFLMDMKWDFYIYNWVYVEYFKDYQFCCIIVGIDSLLMFIVIELKCIVVVDG